MSNEKYLWKYSSSISPQQYIFSLAEMTRTLINVVVCSHWGQAGQLAQERSPHPLKPGCRQWTKVRISLLSDHGALYTVHSTVLYTVQWQFIDCSISAELCRPCSSLTRWHCSAACLSLVTSHSYRLLISQHVFFQNLMELCINAKKLQKQGPISEKWHMENKWPSVWMDKFSDQWNDLSFRKHHWQIVYADKHERIEEVLNISMIKIHIWCIEFMNFNKELFR